MRLNTKDKVKDDKNSSSKGIYNNSVKRNQPMILFDKVCKKYQNGVEAIKNLSFRIEEGEFVFLMGSSGAGKSTLIKLILMEERADDGRILVNSCNLDILPKKHVQRYRRSIGVFFQDFRLLEKKTVFQNVAFAMEITGASRKEIREKVDLTLSIMGLSAKKNELPSHLSGGEQQRVALARAIVNGPDILIADEPTGNLDPENSEQIMTLLKMINARGTTVLVATHEQNLADESGLRIIRLDHGKNVSIDKQKEDKKDKVPPVNNEPRRMEDLFVEPSNANDKKERKKKNFSSVATSLLPKDKFLNRKKDNKETAAENVEPPKNDGPRFIEIKTENDNIENKETAPVSSEELPNQQENQTTENNEKEDDKNA